MASHRAIDPNLIPVGDLFEYNGPFPCFTQPPYNRTRNTSIPLDVPFNPNFLPPEVCDALNTTLSSTAAPSGGLASGGFLQSATPDEMANIADWFLPVNGQEDNLAGLGGNWDYVKWNAMVVACYIKQLQLGPNLRRLIRVHPPVELYCEHDDVKIIQAGIMGKKQFEKFYGREDVADPKAYKKGSTGEPVRISKPTRTPEDKRMDEAVELATERGGEGLGGEGEKEEEEEPDTDVDISLLDSDEDEEDIPDWRKLRPAPTGTTAVPHPLESLYGADAFLPLDASGKWVPPATRPKRDLMTLIDPDDPLFGVLSKAAKELVQEAKLKKAGASGSSSGKVTKKRKPDGGALRTVRRITTSSRAPSSGPKSEKGKTSSDRESYVLHRTGAKLQHARFEKSGLRRAEGALEGSADGTGSATAGIRAPWEKFHSNVGGRGPDFRRRHWPSLRKNLGKKRWHILPVACDVNGELRWWLLVIDMQVQRRLGAGFDKTKDSGMTKDSSSDTPKGGARCIWVINPCSAPSAPTGTLLERFLSEVPRYICRLVENELLSLDHHRTPINFPRSSDANGLDDLQSGTLLAAKYDHPGRFRRFGHKKFINGNRLNWNNRNPHTGIEVIHAMGCVLRMIEAEDAGIAAMWRQIGIQGEALRCSASTATAPSLRDLELLQEADDSMSVQNRVRTETMVEIQRFMDWTHLRGYPFHEQTPDTIPAEGYSMLNLLYTNHADVWRQLSTWFDQGCHAVVVGMDMSIDPRRVVSVPLMPGNMVVLHGRKGRSPADDPNTAWWRADSADDTGIDLLDILPDDDKGKTNPGYLYHRYRHLREDWRDNGSIPVTGGPRDPTATLESEYPQSMISLIIESTGRGVIHVGNRPNGIWKVNGVDVKQSEVLTRFSHVTHLYGGSMHWLFIRRFATSKSENVRVQSTVGGDIQSYRRKQQRMMPGSFEYSTDDPVWAYPRHTYPDELYKKYNFDLGRDTPHFHHHHRPKRDMGNEERILWDSYNNSGNAILCQNPACLRHSRYAKGKMVAAPTLTMRPCFNTDCVADKHETHYYGSSTCTDVTRNRCLPNTDGVLGSHIPGIPGHMFIDNGILLFQPEMLVSAADDNINTQGVIARATKPPPDEGTEEGDINALPLPPLSWNRIVFTPVCRFPSTTAAREFLKLYQNYEPIIIAEGEHSGVAYDMTMYERLNYYRILMWNQIQPTMQRGWWREHEFMQRQHDVFTKYDVNGWSETSFRLGYQPDLQHPMVSGVAGAEEGTSEPSGSTIVGAGDPFAWNLAHGRLSTGALPWDTNNHTEDESHERMGYTSSASILGAYIAPEPTEEPGIRVLRNENIHTFEDDPADIIKILRTVTRRQPFDEIDEVSDMEGVEQSEEGRASSKQRSHKGKNNDKDKPGNEYGLTEYNISKKSDNSSHGDSRLELSKIEVNRTKINPLRTEATSESLVPERVHSIIKNHIPALMVKQQKISPSARGYKDINGNDIILESTDMLLPKIRTIPVDNGVIEERYIQITRPGCPDPILLPATKTFIPNEVVGDHGDRSEGDEQDLTERVLAEKTPDKEAIAEDSGEAIAEDTKKTMNLNDTAILESRLMISEISTTAIPEVGKFHETQIQQENSRIKSHPTVPPPAAEQHIEITESLPGDSADGSKNTAKSAPTTRIEKEKVMERKRKCEEPPYEAPVVPKKRGPKPGQKRKKLNQDDLAYNNKKVDKEVLKQDREFDRLEVAPGAKTVGKKGRPPKTTNWMQQ